MLYEIGDIRWRFVREYIRLPAIRDVATAIRAYAGRHGLRPDQCYAERKDVASND